MWTIFKVFIEFCYSIASVLCFGFLWVFLVFFFFDHEACGILAPWGPGTEPAPPALKGKVLSTGPPGKSHLLFFE